MFVIFSCEIDVICDDMIALDVILRSKANGRVSAI